MKIEVNLNLKELVYTILVSIIVVLGISFLFDNYFFIDIYNEAGELLKHQSVGNFMMIGAVVGVISVRVIDGIVDYLMVKTS